MKADSRSTQRPSRFAPLLPGRTLAALAGDKSGATAIILGLTSMALLGFTALGTEAGYWYFTHRNMQNAADSAALSAVAALENISGTPDSTHMTQATAEATYTSKQYGFTAGTGGVQIFVNIPPTSGAYTAQANAAEVILKEPQQLFLTAALSINGHALFSTKPTQSVRAVATPARNGNGCVVTLDTGQVGDVNLNGNTQLTLPGCDLYVNSDAADALNQVGQATITANAAYITGQPSLTGQATLNVTNGPYTGTPPINDPYAGVQAPYNVGSSCTPIPPITNGSSTVNLSPDSGGVVLWCNGWQPNNMNIHLAPGLYVIWGAPGLKCQNCTISGDNVTIFLTGTGTNYAGIDISGNGNSWLNINAPTDTYVKANPSTKAIEGIAIFGDRNAPCDPTNCVASIAFSGNATETINGVIYLPKQTVTLNGNGNGTPTCSQLISYRATFHGNSTFTTSFSDNPSDQNCNIYHDAITGAGIAGAGAIPAHLVE